jgi:hypothetical protein
MMMSWWKGSAGRPGSHGVLGALLVVAPALAASPVRAGDRSVSKQAQRGAPGIDFNRQIRPLLAKSCFKCHGQDDGKRAASLRLDRREAAVTARGANAPAIVPGRPEASPFVTRIDHNTPARRMPPPSTGLELTSAQRTLLREWVRQGANYSEHWSFVPPVRPRQPVLTGSAAERAWPRGPIDRFVLARLQASGLKPQAEADRFALLRRVSLDLRGLPPTREEVDAFARDTFPGAYERAVDRFLADPAYGERWARMWLDLARYADSAGLGSDPLRTIWGYRDWVIDAFNRNLSFDQFTIEQLAGDLLPGATVEQRMATAFHRNTMTNTEGGTDDEEWRVAAVRDRVDTTLQVWMGLTMGCAKCHSHKYDPVTQREYYQFYSYFNQTADNDQPDERPLLTLPSPDLEARQKTIDAEIAELKRELDPGAAKERPNEARSKELRDRIARLEKERPALPTVPVMVELDEKSRRVTHTMVKGNYRDAGEKVDPAVPAAFHALPADAPPNRLGIARWLVDRANPLTARVAVNRFWAQLFGAGLVLTEEDFGTQGELPTHPELLDWLALEFREGAAGGKPWDVKGLLRVLVTSATYRQTSRVSAEALARDPNNRLFSRGPRVRLEAEMVRDQALAIAGLLSKKMKGPSVYPPQPAGLWQAAFNGQRTWPTSTGEDRYRRGLYTFWRRTVPYPSMATFDAPSREICTIRRIRTNTPLQAFVTLNDPVYVEAAQALARRVLKEGGSTAEERARFALSLCLARPLRAGETQPVLALLESELAHFRGRPEEARKMATEPLGALPDGADAAELAAWTVVANTLLNLDAVLTKG